MMSDSTTTENQSDAVPIPPAWVATSSSTLDEQSTTSNGSPLSQRGGEMLKNRWKQSAAFRQKVGKNITSVRKNVGQNVGPLVKNVGDKLQNVNLLRLIDEMEKDQELADHLEFINQETKQEAEFKEIVREATEACQKEIEEHLDDFLERRPDATYEEWIKEIHPDNIEQGKLLGGDDFEVVDIRFYVEDSDHRLLWNERVPQERHVAARSLKGSFDSPQAIDLLDDHQQGVDTAPSTDGSSSSNDGIPNFTSGTESWEDAADLLG